MISPRKQYTRDIFRNGRYVDLFQPDSFRNPFQRLYDQKREYVLKFIEQRDDFMKILDIGSGTARIASAVDTSQGRSVICADISIDMLKMGQDRCGQNHSLDFVQSDAHRLPFANESFNCIIALDLLCHLAIPKIALQEFHRILTDSGILVLDSTNSIPLWAFFYPRYVGANPLKWCKIMRLKGVLPGWEGIVNHYTKSQFLSQLSWAHFQVNQILIYGPRICPKWHLAIAKKN